MIDEPRAGLPEMPMRIAKLRIHRGWPVPWFVNWESGIPDFRVIKPGAATEAWALRRCWICGGGLGSTVAFVVGPMCAVNRVSAEPPSHVDCATWSALACPFLTRPHMVRRERNLPEDVFEPAGVMLKHNPGATLVWVAKLSSAKARRVPGDGVLYDIGTPERALWFAEGGEATREQVLAAIKRGLPILQEAAEADGPGAVLEFQRRLGQLNPLLPPAVDDQSWMWDEDLAPEQEDEHLEKMREIAGTHGFPLSDWQPTLKQRAFVAGDDEA